MHEDVHDVVRAVTGETLVHKYLLRHNKTARMTQCHNCTRHFSFTITGEILAGEGEEGVFSLQAPAAAQLKQISCDVHDILCAVTGEILAGEGEEGVLGLQVPAETQA